MNKIKYIFILILNCIFINTHAQFTNGVTGLLHMPNAEMQEDGTVVLGGNFLNKHNLPNNFWWGYNTYNYFVNITFLNRLEISYIMTLVKGQQSVGYWPQTTWGKFCNQDRQFAARLQIIKEGELWKYMPSFVIGINDPTTGSGGGNYADMNVKGSGNGYFNRMYAAVTKHIHIPYGELGIHVTYLKNQRTDYPLNGLGWGINFRPDFHRNLNLIVEHDTKTLNVGALYSLWADHFNVLFELQDCKYISAGFVYKVNLLGGNRWNSKLFDY